MARTYVRRRATLAVLGAILVGAVVGPLGHVFAADAAPRQVRTVVVRPGDSLWTLARRLAPGDDPRAVVDAIERANQGLRPQDVLPGQRLVIPEP